MSAIERLRVRPLSHMYKTPELEALHAADLAAVDALYQTAKAHLAHTAGYCVDRVPDGDATCRTHKSLAAAVRQVEDE